MNRYFYTEIENLRSRLILMGERTSEIFKTSLSCLFDSELSKCDETVGKLSGIHELEKEIDREAMRYISLRSPVASDLRTIMLAVKTASNLERIGEEAVSISNRSKNILSLGRLSVDPLRINEMAVVAQEILNLANGLFLESNAGVYDLIIQKTEGIDRMNLENVSAYVAEVESNPSAAMLYFELSLISKSIERISDHVFNIAQDMSHLVGYGELSVAN
ncbi:MAG: hypothetical protein MI748_06705 [Opitutales bacterium]|nr:hypothetical protein [Opitutales bacterium]